MMEIIGELLDCQREFLMERVGLDPNDFEDTEIQELLDVPNETKKGLDYSSEEEEAVDDESDEEPKHSQ
jgi:hypothetical protein